MNRKVQRLGFAFGGVLLVTLLWVRLFPADDLVLPATAAVDAAASAQQRVDEATLSPSPDLTTQPRVTPPEGGEVAATASRQLRTYAVSTYELAGLPPDAEPGTRLELWAALDPPIVEESRFMKLRTEVVLEKIVPGLTPEAPATALLLVGADRLSDLLYLDRYGELSVAVIP
jgi:hypothetical protein